MKNFVIITGPQAVGKMAVGMKMKEMANYRLFHNHMTIEFVKDLYGELNKDNWSLIGKLREQVFDDVLTRDYNFIFTYVCDFDMQSEHDYVNNLIKRFEESGFRAIIVELEANVDVRLGRNGTPLRLEHKATKRDTEWSDRDLVKSMSKHRLNSHPGEIKHPNYIRINNEDKSVDLVADEIFDYISTL